MPLIEKPDEGNPSPGDVLSVLKQPLKQINKQGINKSLKGEICNE
jgi:hypothetical protein